LRHVACPGGAANGADQLAVRLVGVVERVCAFKPHQRLCEVPHLNDSACRVGGTLLRAIRGRGSAKRPVNARRDIGLRQAVDFFHLRVCRSAAQRTHDALNAALRALLASGTLGQHNGLPAGIIVTTTLRELEAGCGKALTGGGSLLPMSDVIRLASHAHNYLAIFDKGRPLALYHRRRLASPAQRIMLYAKDRGCTHPGCDVPGYLTEVHHVTPWATTKETNIDDLTLGCGPHHKLAEQGWITRKRVNGDTEWIPPPHLDHGQTRINTFHHPEKLLRDDGDDADDQLP